MSILLVKHWRITGGMSETFSKYAWLIQHVCRPAVCSIVLSHHFVHVQFGLFIGAKEIDLAATLEHLRDQRMNLVHTEVGNVILVSMNETFL